MGNRALITEADEMIGNRDQKYQSFLDRDIEDEKNYPLTLSWLLRCPPPKTWEGTVLEWAYCEMPIGLFTRKPGHFF